MVMNSPRHHFLAHSAFTGDQHPGVAGGNQRNVLADGQQGAALSEHFAAHRRRRWVVAERTRFLDQLPVLQGAGEGEFQFLGL